MFSIQQSTDDHEPTYTHYDDDDDFIDDAFNATGVSRSGRVYPIFCKALYDFEVSHKHFLPVITMYTVQSAYIDIG